ncbi:hypothetical protein C4D60_Mb02t01680 [Musa balbisiana]|uniref:Uncharacterized protein n=1 Tax=Musa balbisiana TaxID=52838 RepID=A0A4V6T3Y0_MUSBA|nr:hypothetical protein C4D60_Mb02t01680 [Musa balbisiana]
MGHMNRNQDIGIGLCSLWDGQVRWKPRKQAEQAYDRSSIGCVGHVKSGYALGWSASTSAPGGRTTLSVAGHKKKASDFRGTSLFTTALCRQLLYLPFDSAYAGCVNSTQ